MNCVHKYTTFKQTKPESPRLLRFWSFLNLLQNLRNHYFLPKLIQKLCTYEYNSCKCQSHFKIRPCMHNWIFYMLCVSFIITQKQIQRTGICFYYSWSLLCNTNIYWFFVFPREAKVTRSWPKKHGRITSPQYRIEIPQKLLEGEKRVFWRWMGTPTWGGSQTLSNGFEGCKIESEGNGREGCGMGVLRWMNASSLRTRGPFPKLSSSSWHK